MVSVILESQLSREWILGPYQCTICTIQNSNIFWNHFTELLPLQSTTFMYKFYTYYYQKPLTAAYFLYPHMGRHTRLWPHVCDDSDSILTWLRVTEPFSLPDISLHWNIYRYCCEGLTEVVIQVSGDDERARAQLWEKTKTHPLLAHRHNVLWRREGCSANSISIIMRIYFCLIIMYLTLIWYCNVIFFLWQEVANRGLVMYLLYVHFEEFHRNVLHNEFIEQAVYRGCHSPWTMLCCIF